jgi:hypothetical protein
VTIHYSGQTGVTGSVLKLLAGESISVTLWNPPATMGFDGSPTTYEGGLDHLHIQFSPNAPSARSLSSSRRDEFPAPQP